MRLAGQRNICSWIQWYFHWMQTTFWISVISALPLYKLFELTCSYNIHDIQLSHTWSWLSWKWSTEQLAPRTSKTKSSSNTIHYTERMRLAGQHIMQLNSMVLPFSTTWYVCKKPPSMQKLPNESWMEYQFSSFQCSSYWQLNSKNRRTILVI
jgi:hypothetical protein